jgi:hypothetical protein
MQRIPDFRSVLDIPPFTADHTGLYQIVAEAVARQPDHLAELVRLFVALNRAGVQVHEHVDCAMLALCEERENGYDV